MKHLKTQNQLKESSKIEIACPKHKDGKLLCSTCKNYCTITGEKIPKLEDRF